ncbi:MAG: hypothetical protein Q7T96_01810 [Methylobacter sp.]|nr:hypothetical protein [Methylobacter sp.]
MILTFYYSPRTTAWTQEVELRLEQQSRAPTVGALGDAGQKNAPAFSAFITSM